MDFRFMTKGHYFQFKVKIFKIMRIQSAALTFSAKNKMNYTCSIRNKIITTRKFYVKIIFWR